MGLSKRAWITGTVLVSLARAPWAAAGDLGGSARVYGGTTRVNDRMERVLSQDYALRFSQPLTPWVAFSFGFNAADFRVDAEEADTFDRTSREPSLELTYQRPGFYGRLGWRERQARGSSDADVFDVESRYAQFSWKPRAGPRVSVRLDRSRNVADVAVFGRDVQSTTAELGVHQVARTWSARYSIQDFEVDNQMTDYRLGQVNNLVQATWGDHFLDDRLHLSTDVRVRRTDQTERLPPGAVPPTPLVAVEGLAPAGTVDDTPDLGPLDPVAGLADGNPGAATVPPIDIGGAAINRNIGLDLGFTQPVTRLVITVDRQSDAALLWHVWHGGNNLTWERIDPALVVRSFETFPFFGATLFRYTLQFPETTDRFFKAVNVSTNAFDPVQVTEIQALVDLPRETDRRASHSTNSRVHLVAGFTPGQRVSGRLVVGYSESGGAGGGLPLVGTRELTYESLLAIDLNAATDARIQYHRGRFERDQAPLLVREETRYDTSLLWHPIAAVEGLLTAGRREESDRGALLRRTDAIGARAMTELLPGLRLTSEVAWNTIEDPFSGFSYSSWTFRETFETRPTEQVIFNGGLSYQTFDTTGRLVLRERTAAYGRADWTPTPHLSLGGEWTHGAEDGRRTLSQRYDLSVAPGERLALSASYATTDSYGDLETRTAGANLNYRLNASMNLFATYARSALNQALAEASRVSTLQFGLTAAF